MKKTAFEFGRFVSKKMAAGPAGPFGTNKGNPTALQSYGNTLDRWYNPWSKQQGLERGEEGLMRAGQGSMGVAGLAGGAALAPAAGLGVAGTPAAFTPASAAAYGGVVGSLSAGTAALQHAVNGPQKPPAPAPAPAAAAPKPAAPTPAVPK